ncbi:hypothetical protein DPMN_122205 [Dreissena polymorpha]|uniref:Uncharacterized protein n=1 Tax=Dreissena polymorpha TaxID=45954 RepID=A0A9D4JRS5_DREPO|nr:hypothetical protein DPMN_122205 [Dreissena polymorpha]
MQYIANFANTAPDIYTAVTLLKLLISLAEKADDQTLMKKLGENDQTLMNKLGENAQTLMNKLGEND